MLLKDVKPGECISLPDGGSLYVTTGPESDNVTGCLFVTGLLEDGTESRYFATEDALVTMIDDGD